MSGGICRRKGYEVGAWYEIECIRRDIVSKGSKGKDASFERHLLKSWSKYPGYEDAKNVLRGLRHS